MGMDGKVNYILSVTRMMMNTQCRWMIYVTRSASALRVNRQMRNRGWLTLIATHHYSINYVQYPVQSVDSVRVNFELLPV
jgi:hypothetical protein